jgi:hypothetical protein
LCVKDNVYYAVYHKEKEERESESQKGEKNGEGIWWKGMKVVRIHIFI